MTYIVNDACIKCKHMDCVEVCPVDCFYEGENFLAINPQECIDCGVCEPECPAGAIYPDTDMTPYLQKWLDINTKYSTGPDAWPVITSQRQPMENADDFNPKMGYEGWKGQYLSEKPGEGN